ncbi:MAG: DUF2189 domain-containing protein, partial [Pseudomonadota bacterium]
MSETGAVNQTAVRDGDTQPAVAPISAKPVITVNDITFADIKASLAGGWQDFMAAPKYGLFFGAVYAVGGMAILIILNALGLPFLAFPMATGFALIAPFVASGLYEVSRRLETGEPLSWSAVLGSIRNQASRDLGWMALIATFAFYIWVDMAGIIYLMFFGLNLLAPLDFLRTVFTTTDGLLFLLIGNVTGAILAALVFSITAMSFPLLHDRDVDFATAMITSVDAVRRNPGPMLA